MNNQSNKPPLSEENFESLRAPSRSREAKLATLTNIKSTIHKPRLRLLYPLSIAAAVLLFGLFLSPILLESDSNKERSAQQAQTNELDSIPLFIKISVAESLEKDVEDLQTSDLAKVEHLQLSLKDGDKLQSSLQNLDSLAEMENLKSLKIRGVPAENFLFLNELKSLEMLSISWLKEEYINELEAMPNVTSLELTDGNIASLQFLEKFPSLTHLNLSANNFSSLEGIQQVQGLTSLYLMDNSIPTVRELKELEKLETLVLKRTPIYDVTPLADLHALSYLDIRDTKVEKVAPLAALENLEILVTDMAYVKDIVSLPPHVIVTEQPLSGEWNEEEQATFIGINRGKQAAEEILGAMKGKEYAYLERFLSQALSIDSSNNQLVHAESGEVVNFIEIDDIEKLEFRFHDLSPDEVLTLGYAYYYEDTHLTIYFEFIKEAGEWKLFTLRTDA